MVACGLLLSRRSAEFFSPAVRLQIYAVWSAIVFILNGVVFVRDWPAVVGDCSQPLRSEPAAPRDSKAPSSAHSSWCCGSLWLTPGARLSYFIRRRFLHQTDGRPPARELLVFGWSGMRGVLSLAAAGSLPLMLPNGAPFPQRSMIVFLTFSVVIWTLVVQGLTLAPLARALGLAGGIGENCEMNEARRIALQAALDHLEESRSHDRPEDAGVYDDLAQHYRERIEALTRAADDTHRDAAAVPQGPGVVARAASRATAHSVAASPRWTDRRSGASGSRTRPRPARSPDGLTRRVIETLGRPMLSVTVDQRRGAGGARNRNRYGNPHHVPITGDERFLDRLTARGVGDFGGTQIAALRVDLCANGRRQIQSTQLPIERVD